jgi:hypothetical protein
MFLIFAIIFILIQHNAEQYSAFVERHMDERRQRVEQLDAFVRHRLRLYREAQEHVQRQTTNKTVPLISYLQFLFLKLFL